MLGPYYRECSI